MGVITRLAEVPVSALHERVEGGKIPGKVGTKRVVRVT